MDRTSPCNSRRIPPGANPSLEVWATAGAGRHRHRGTDAARGMSEIAGAIPTPQSLPGSWPREYADEVQKLGHVILTHWRDTARARGHELHVLYVPRSEAMLRGDYPLTQTWRPWLGKTCAALGLPLIDPSDALVQRLRSEHVYDDHWTAAGHEVIAEVLREHLLMTIQGTASQQARP